MEQVSLNTPQPQMEPIQAVPFQNNPAPSVPSDSVVQQRATKAAIGLPGWMAKDDIALQISNGNEAEIRANAAAHVSEERSRIRDSLITKIMAAKQGQVTDEEKDAVSELIRQNTNADPRTVFEENYPIRYFENIKEQAQQNPDSSWQTMNPAQRDAYLKAGSAFMAKDQTANTLYEEFYTRAENQGYFGWMLDRAKEFLIPGYDFYKGQGGTQLRNESADLYALPLDEFKLQMAARAAKLAEDNPAQAVHWLAAMRGQSNSEEALNNLFVGAALIPPVGTGLAAKGVRTAADALYMRNMVKSALKTNIKEQASPAAVHEAAGAIKEAAVSDTAQQVVDNVAGKTSIKSILDNLPGIFQGAIDNLKNNPGHLRREAVERIMQSYEQAKLLVINAASNSIKIDRLPVLGAVKQAVRDLAEVESTKYPELKNTLLNNALRYEPSINGHYVDFYLGKTGDSLFSTEKSAQNVITKKQLTDAVVEQQGSGFAIVISKPLGETGYVRDILLHTEDVKTPQSWLNSVVGRLRTPEETLSVSQRQARKAAAYGPAAYQQMAKIVTKDIQNLRSWSSLPYSNKRQKWLDFQKVINSIEKEPKWFDNVGDVEQLYQKSIGRLPDDQEIAAAFAWKRGEELYQTWRDLQAYKNLHRLGAETHTISLPTMETKGTYSGFQKFSFTGKRLSGDELSKIREDTVMILGKKLGEEQLKATRSVRGDWELAEKIKKGEASVYQILNHADQPLTGMSKATRDQFPRYVIDPDGGRISSQRLEWKQYGKRPPQYDYDHYIKQAIVKYDSVSNKHLYIGDKTIAVHNLRAMSEDVANKLDRIRQLLYEKNEPMARQFHSTSGLEQEFSEIKGWFEKGLPIRAAGGKFTPGAPARLSLTDPIRSIPKGKMLIETHKDLDVYKKMGGGLNDLAHEGSARYLGEKQHYDPQDVFTHRNDGTAQNPLYKIAPVNYLNPIDSMNRALIRITNTQFMDDYKAFSVEHWIQEAMPYLKASKEEIERAPYWYFHNADNQWKDLKGDDVIKVANLKTARLQVQQFLGVPSPTSAWLHSAAQKLSDSLYSQGSARTALATEWLLPKIRDPYTALRSFTFHSKLGLFNWTQLLTQAQTYANIWAISPKFAGAGTRAALLYTWSQVNRHPEILQHFDKMMTKGTGGIFAWKPGEWLEGTKFLEQSGFLKVAGEQAFRDTPFKNNIITDGRQTFLDWGAGFFNNGEKSVRLGAGYTAFKEWRTKNPTGALTNKAKLEILNRADDLYANMSRASSSQLQHGIFSIPTQFVGYQLRVAEQFLGKRLTYGEKARLFGVYAGLYGIPGAFGLTGLPVGEYLRKWSTENGYTVGENWAQTAINEGIPSLLTGLVSGVYPGYQAKFGTQGVDLIREALMGDKTVWDLMTGASGGQLHNIFGTMGINGNFGAMHGFYKAVGSLISMDDQFPFKIDDLAEPLKQVSSFGNVWKAITAFNTGYLVSSREANLGDASPINIILQSLTGLQDQRVLDNYLKGNIRKEEEALQKYTLSKFTEDVRRAIVANKNGDPEQAKAFLIRARSWLQTSNYPQHQMGAAWSIALEGYQSMVNRGDWDWAFGDKKPPSRDQSSVQQYIATQKQQQGNQ